MTDQPKRTLEIHHLIAMIKALPEDMTKGELCACIDALLVGYEVTGHDRAAILTQVLKRTEGLTVISGSGAEELRDVADTIERAEMEMADDPWRH